MRIICIKWGDKYPAEYVYRLKAGCERFIPHREFWCMTDKRIPDVDCIPMNTDHREWWTKLGLFRNNYFWGDNLYLDLDIVITGSIDPLIAAYESDKSKLWALDDFSYSIAPYVGKGNNEESGWLGGPQQSTVNSSVMFWQGATNGTPLEDVFHVPWREPEVLTGLHGDQNWITRCLWPDHIRLLPTDGVVGSYKYHSGQVLPLVVFHGNPKPHEVEDDFVREYWGSVRDPQKRAGAV